MSGRTRRIWFVIVGAIAVCLSLAALAWACTPEATLHVTPSSGAPGTTMTFTGSRFASGPVQIRMDSVSGAPIATATGPSFSVTVRIPDTTPGYHVFGAVGDDANGNVAGESSLAFRVTGPTAPTSRPSKSTPIHRPSQHTPSRSAARPQPVSPHRSVRASAPPKPVVSAPRSPAAAAVLPAPSLPVHKVAVEPPRTGHSVALPAPAAPRPQHLQPRAGRSAWMPKPGVTGTTASSGSTPVIAIGIGLLAAGLVALFAGFAVAEVRRRRVRARVPRQ